MVGERPESEMTEGVRQKVRAYHCQIGEEYEGKCWNVIWIVLENSTDWIILKIFNMNSELNDSFYVGKVSRFCDPTYNGTTVHAEDLENAQKSPNVALKCHSLATRDYLLHLASLQRRNLS